MKLPPDHANLFPYLMVPDAPGLLAFVKATFGAEILGTSYREGQLANARVRIGQVGFMIAEASPMLSATAALYLFVEDADATFASAVDAGCEVIFAVEDMPYGDRQGGVRDPWGNIWFISTRLVDGPYQD